MRAISGELFVQILAKHREWDALAKYALHMAESARLARDDPAALVRRELAAAREIENRRAQPILRVIS